MYKTLYRLGHLAYLVLFIFAILFYKERTVFVDIAYHMFHILRTGDFAIQNYRFVAGITQLFPLVGSKFSLSLDTISILYSAGFILYYFGCYIICGAVLKNYRFALVLLCFNILFVSESYYWMQSELPQGAAMMLVVLSYISNRNIKDMHPAAVVLIITALAAFAFAHAMLLFPFIYTLLFLALRNEPPPSRKLLIITGALYFTAILLKNLFFKTQYDSEAMAHGQNLARLFPHYINLPSNKQFIYDCIHNYYWIPICGALVCLRFISQKKWLQLALFIISATGYLLLVNVSLPDAPSARFYVENLYLPLGIIIGVPLVYEVFPVLEQRRLATVFFAAIVLTGLFRIYRCHDLYTHRLNWERDFLAKNMDKKIAIEEKLIPSGTPYFMVWGTPYEFWLLSTTENGRSASIIFSNNIKDIEWALGERKSVLTTWGTFPYKDLPNRYFKFQDTVSNYTLLKAE